MKRKLNRYIIGTAILALSLALAFTTLVFWKESERQSLEIVRSITELIASYDDASDPQELEKCIAEWKQGDTPVRITRIAADGTVLFDNFADASAMENHAQRPEIKAAMESGTGSATRSSYTLGGRMTCYYARLLQDGSVLRGAVTTNSMQRVFRGVFPYILAIAAGVILLAALFSWYLTSHFIDPIEKMTSIRWSLRHPGPTLSCSRCWIRSRTSRKTSSWRPGRDRNSPPMFRMN
jgi:two-component system phosphate regulon sensor histidine kinase PhoR